MKKLGKHKLGKSRTGKTKQDVFLKPEMEEEEKSALAEEMKRSKRGTNKKP